MLKAAQVGLGWWGSQVTKVLRGSDKIEVVCGIDPAEATRDKYHADHSLPVFPDFEHALRDAAVRLLGDFDKDRADPLLATLWACPLLAAPDGSAVKLAELFALQRRYGRILTTRKPGRSEERRVWLVCEEDSLFLSRTAVKERWTFSE